MTDDMVSREALHELLFDDVAPPAGSDAMFAQTFAAEGSAGADLLPPDGLFDIPADADDADLDPADLDPADLDPADLDPADLDPADLDPTDPSSDEYSATDVAPADHDAHDAHDAPGHDATDDTGHDPTVDHHDPGTGW